MKTISLILTLVFSVIASGQKMPADYFGEASKFFDKEVFDKALTGYQFIVDNYPSNELYPKAFYNVGYIHFIQKDYDKAIVVFKAILESDFNEKESSGGGIMADPYANFRHRSGEILSDIYFEKKMFETALHYFILSDTTYPYMHFCGNEYASNDVHTALRYAAIYQALNQPDKAIEKLLPAVFISLADNSEVITTLEKLLTGRKGVRQEIDVALNKIYSKKINSGNDTYNVYYFKFIGVELRVPGGYVSDKKKFDESESIKKIKESDFYKMIARL